MAKNNKDEITAVPAAAPLAQVDEEAEFQRLMGEYASAGVENVTSDDIVLPRLLMLQPTSPLSSEDPFRAGYLVNSVSREHYGAKYAFYVIHYYGTRVHWESKEIGSPIDCRSDNNLTGIKQDADHGNGVCAACPYSSWNRDGNTQIPPECTEFKNLIVVPADKIDNIPMMFSAKRTGVRAIQEFLSAVKFSKQPMFAYQYMISSKKTENARGTFYTPELTRGPKVSDLATLKELIKLNTQMRESQDRIAGPTLEDEGLAEGAGDDIDGDDAAF